MISAVVPARCGSKRVPGKNYRKLLNRPLVDWTIEFALRQSNITQIIVATDCIELVNASNYLRNLSKKMESVKEGNLLSVTNNLFLYWRTKVNASDNAKTLQLIQEMNDLYETNLLLLLQPTSPFRTLSEFPDVMVKFHESNYHSLFSIKAVESPHPLKSFTLNEKGKIIGAQNLIKNLTSPQGELPKMFTPDGAYYLSKVERLLKCNYLIDENSGTFLREFNTMNIDTEFDFQIAELFAGEFQL